MSEPLVLGIRMFQVEETGSSKALSLKHVWGGKSHISGTARRSVWLENSREK